MFSKYLDDILRKQQKDIFSKVFSHEFSPDYAQNIQDALDDVYQRQFNQALSDSKERELASGAFNADLSKYYATKGAGENQVKGKVSALEAARNDEYNRYNAMLNAARLKLEKDSFDFQKQAYEDSKPSFWESLIGGVASGAGMLLPFFKKGGKVKKPKKSKIKKVMNEFKKGLLKTSAGKKVSDKKQALAIALSEATRYKQGGDIKDSQYFYDNYNGYIPENEKMLDVEDEDNVPIMAKDGEFILTEEATKLAGKKNLENLNKMAKTLKQHFQNKQQGGFIMKNKPKIQGGISGGGTAQVAPPRASAAADGGEGFFKKALQGLYNLKRFQSGGEVEDEEEMTEEEPQGAPATPKGKQQQAQGATSPGKAGSPKYTLEQYIEYNTAKNTLDDILKDLPIDWQRNPNYAKTKETVDGLMKVLMANPFNKMTPEMDKWKKYYFNVQVQKKNNPNFDITKLPLPPE